MDLDELVMKYAIGANVRYKRKQKNKYVSMLGDEFQKMNYQVRGVIGKYNFHKALNLTVGDLLKADKIYICPYDTPARSYGKKSDYYPLDGKNNFNTNFLTSFLPLLLFGLIGLFYILYVLPKIDFILKPVWSVFLVIIFIGLMLIAYFMTMGIANQVNFNRNSAGVITLINMASMLSDAEKEKVAFVFTDYSYTSHAGDKMLRNALPKTIDNRKIVYLDCVGNGQEFVIGYRDKSTQDSKTFSKCFAEHPLRKKLTEDNMKFSSISYYPRGLIITKGSRTPAGFVVENTQTKEDMNIDFEAIEKLSEALKKYILQ